MSPHRRLSWRSGVTRTVLASAFAVGSLVLGSGAAQADEADEQQLADTFAPVLMLVVQDKPCGPGEPYQPSDVDLLMDESSVALRGPWTQNDLVDVAPSADALSAGLSGYSLDFPGNPLKPGCGYEEWADEIWAESEPTIYAHVATQKGHPDQIALQYWFYYPFNDFNNKHEGDWERIQLEFDVGDAATAVDSEPVQVAYSQHNGSELSSWDDPKLELVDGTRPVVYVAAGSHASHYSSAVFLLRSGTQGLGCDSTLEPVEEIQPAVQLIASNPEVAASEHPWIAFDGRWGQREKREFFDGPTGPNTRDQWTAPFTWSDRGGDRSYPVPGSGLFGVSGTDFFCSAVAAGSNTFLNFTADPWPTLAVITLIVVLVVWQVRRMAWGSADPVPVLRERAFSQVVAASWWMFRSRIRVFGGIGLVVVAMALVLSVAQRAQDVLWGDVGGERAVDGSDIWLGLAATLESLVLAFALGLAVAATTRAVAEIDAGREVTVRRAYRLALHRGGALAGALALWSVLLILLAFSVLLLPVAVVCTIGWSLFIPVLELQQRSGIGALRRSWRLVRGQFVKVAALLVLGVLLALLLGGVLSTGVLLAVQAPFSVVNMLPGIVAALMVPYFSLLTTYAYFHGRAREEEAALLPSAR